MVSNTLYNKQYNSFGSLSITKIYKFRNEWKELLNKLTNNFEERNIILNRAPNRIGKTITTLKYFDDINAQLLEEWDENSLPRILYLGDRHSQITEVRKTLNNIGTGRFTQWYGIKHLCKRKNEPLISFMLNNHISTGIICSGCQFAEKCRYKAQFNVGNVIVGAPKEFLPSKHVQSKMWDHVIVDEVIDKARKIEPVCPVIPEKAFDEYGLNDDIYEVVYYHVDNYVNGECRAIDELDKVIDWMVKEGYDGYNWEFDPDKSSKYRKYIKAKNECEFKKKTINYFNEDVDYFKSSALLHLITEVKKGNIDLRNDYTAQNLFKFFNNLENTVDWIESCFKYGYMPHFYRPYIYDVFDLSKRWDIDVILLNTSLERHIYDSIVKNYNEELPKPIEYSFDIENKGSALLHYNFKYRSCPKSVLFETNEKGQLKLQMLNKPKIRRDSYGENIFKMAMSALKKAKEKGLKTGVITYMFAHHLFTDKADVVGYFGGHQGSNKFDDVDVLVIVGTYTLNPNGLYHKHYILNNEFLGDNPANWNKYEYINGVRIRVSDNEKLNRVKMYKLNEEHGQAIFRSGAHVNDGKIVIVFGFVPEGVESKLSYGTFSSVRGLQISMGKWLKKFEGGK